MCVMHLDTANAGMCSVFPLCMPGVLCWTVRENRGNSCSVGNACSRHSMYDQQCDMW